MNTWYRIVVLAKGAKLKVPGIRAALHDYAGSHIATYYEGGPAFEFTSDNCLLQKDEHDIVKAVWLGNGAPCEVIIREHHVEESDPEESNYAKDHEFPSKAN